MSGREWERGWDGGAEKGVWMTYGARKGWIDSKKMMGRANGDDEILV